MSEECAVTSPPVKGLPKVSESSSFCSVWDSLALRATPLQGHGTARADLHERSEGIYNLRRAQIFKDLCAMQAKLAPAESGSGTRRHARGPIWLTLSCSGHAFVARRRQIIAGHARSCRQNLR
jgi:hypothetical protein